VTTSFSDYLQLYHASWSKLQKRSPQLSSYEDRSLYTTWNITFDRIKRQNPASARLLKWWAYFDRQDLWFGLLHHARSTDNELIQKLADDELNFNEAITLLYSFGLVDVDRSLPQPLQDGRYSVHSCVHSWTVAVLNKEWDKDLATLAIACVAAKVPSTTEKDWWLIQRRLLQHATRQYLFVTDNRVSTDKLSWAFYNLGLLYADQGKLAEAEKMYVRALRGNEEALGPDHTSTLDTVNNLGALYADQGKLAEAEKMYIRALQGYEKALGIELMSSYLPALHTMFAFGDLYSRTDRKDMAKEMYSRASCGYAAVQGPSSKWCLEIEGRLQKLHFASTEPRLDRTPAEKGGQETKSRLRKVFHRLRI
jgi:tetratricopeptide (TPR) repeat protein